ncbi:MAG: hypothetical protein ACRD9Y_15965 [Blastocatellia bacterium]
MFTRRATPPRRATYFCCATLSNSSEEGESETGLALSRPIAEGHGGMLTLENRAAGKGREARMNLPL